MHQRSTRREHRVSADRLLGSGVLAVLGFSLAEKSVYAAVLGLPEVTGDAACRACPQLDPAKVRAALLSLAGRGLLPSQPGVPDGYVPLAPETVLGIELVRREQEFGQAQMAVAGLGRRYRATPLAFTFLLTISRNCCSVRSRTLLGEKPADRCTTAGLVCPFQGVGDDDPGGGRLGDVGPAEGATGRDDRGWGRARRGGRRQRRGGTRAGGTGRRLAAARGQHRGHDQDGHATQSAQFVN